MSTSISRRSFLSGAVLAGVGAAGVTLAGCSPSPTKKELGTTGDIDARENGQLPSVEQSQISQTVEVDVAVIGLGIAGVAALRSAAEHGLKVIGIERCATPSSRSCTFAYFNTDRARSMNIADVPPAEIANEIMIQGSHYPNMGILVDFARHCGEAVDWYCDAYNPNMVWTDDFAAIPADENELYAMSCTYYMKSPFLESAYEEGRDHEKIFMAAVDFSSQTEFSHQPILEANVAAAEKAGAQTVFNSRACQLVYDGTAVTGVIVHNLVEDTYTQYNTSKGVVLATGGYTHNDELMKEYLPHIWSDIDHYTLAYPHTDANGDFADTGDGLLMGRSIGAKVENAPHVPMAHSTLTSTLGVDAFLQLNANGERYINEDLSIDHFTINMMSQPKKTIYQFFDGNWQEQMGAMQAGLGAYTTLLMPDAAETIDEWTTAHGDTLEELVAQLDVDKDVQTSMLASFKRYNELCEKGIDEDFGKTPERMFKLETPPFYAVRFTPQDENPAVDKLRLLVTMSGLHTTRQSQCLDEQDDPIRGLYAIGNTQGGRFGVTYPVTLAGASHSIALTAGYLIGETLAAL